MHCDDRETQKHPSIQFICVFSNTKGKLLNLKHPSRAMWRKEKHKSENKPALSLLRYERKVSFQKHNIQKEKSTSLKQRY